MVQSHLPMVYDPIGSMYAIYGDIYHQYTPNVSIYTIHGSYGDVYVPFMLNINHEPVRFGGPAINLARLRGSVQDLEAKFEAAANLIAKGTPTKGSASTDAPRSPAVMVACAWERR